MKNPVTQIVILQFTISRMRYYNSTHILQNRSSILGDTELQVLMRIYILLQYNIHYIAYTVVFQ